MIYPLAARLPVLALLAVVVCFVPYGVDCTCNPGDSMVNVVKSEASAVQVSNPLELIENMAEAAGMSTGDFVAVCSGAAASASGMIIARDTGIKMGQSASVNLGNLIDTADYPAWEKLSSDSQSVYGSKTNYDAAKFNSLMAAFSLDGVVDGWYQSGGSNFDPDQNALERLQQIGRIGQNWGNGVYNYFSSLSGSSGVVTSPVKAQQWASVNQYQYDGSSVENWPSGVPYNIVYGTGTVGTIVKPGNETSYYYQIQSASSVVKIVNYRSPRGTAGYKWSCIVMLSKTPFSVGQYSGYDGSAIPPTDTTVEGDTVNGDALYCKSYITSAGAEYVSASPAMNEFTRDYSYSTLKTVWHAIMYGNGLGYAQPFQDYPTGNDTVPADTKVYMPDNGLQPGQTWNTWITQPEQPPQPGVRPENPYNPVNPSNPGYQSGTPEWKETTTENMQPLLNVRLDKLFPFCLLYDLNMLWGKVQGLMQQNGGLSGQDYEDYLHVRFPVEMVSPDLGIYIQEELEFDLTPLHDLLLMTKQIVLVLLIVMTLLSIIQFWKRILTGG